jgi:hypothetical protein
VKVPVDTVIRILAAQESRIVASCQIDGPVVAWYGDNGIRIGDSPDERAQISFRVGIVVSVPYILPAQMFDVDFHDLFPMFCFRFSPAIVSNFSQLIFCFYLHIVSGTCT